jgi:protein TonB
VLVQVLLDEEGKVIAAQAVGSGQPLHAAAVEAAREARFKPTLLEGKPVKVSGYLAYDFALP